MSNREPTEESFLKDVEKHEMKVLLDNGLYRHLRFASTGPHSWNQWFDIVTFPDRLVYTGDMGTYVFARLEDMFDFFRTRPKDGDKKLYINLGYWGEKLQAADGNSRWDSGYRIFSPEKFKEQVEEQIKDWCEEDNLSKDHKRQLRNAVQDQVLGCEEDGEHAARQALDAFSWDDDEGGRKFEFQDTFEWDFETYAYRYIWCCYAIAYGIQKYDALKSTAEVAA